MLENARDPFNVPRWSTESSIDSSPRGNSSFGRGNGNLSRLNVEPENGGSELDLTLEGSRKKLTWISREDHNTSTRNSLGNDRPSTQASQNGSMHGQSARFGVPDSPGRPIYQPPESPTVQSGSAYARSGRFGVLDSPGRGILKVPESPNPQSGSAYGRSARFEVPDSPGRGTLNVPESRNLQSGSAYGRSARFTVPDSPGRGILNVPESPNLQSGSAYGRSARFTVPDSPGRGILNVPESPNLQSGSAYGRSARFAVSDSPGRRILNVPESPNLQSGSAYGRSARFAVSDSPGRGVLNVPESPNLQSGSAYGRSARFAVSDSPGRGILNVPESPARRGESVRQIRTPSMDIDIPEAPSSATLNRRLRSQTSHRTPSFKATLGIKSDHNVVREANPIRRLSTSAAARDERMPLKPRVQLPTDESAIFSPILDSPEGDRMAVSYLADETDRIIKGRIRKLHLRPHDSNAPDQLRTADHERSSAGEARIVNEGRWLCANSFRQIDRPSANSLRRIDRTKVDTVDPADDKHAVGEFEHESDVQARKWGTLSLPGSPLVSSTLGEENGLSRRISATMEDYFESRRKGSNLGPQIIVPSRLATPPPHPNLASLRQANQLENPSTSSKIGVGSKHDVDRLTASRAALSPLNGNEDMSHSTTSLLPQSKEEYVSEDPNYRGRRRDSNAESVRVHGENGFLSRLQYWTEFLGKGEINSSEGLRHLTQSTEEITSSSGRKELRIKIPPVRQGSNGALGPSSQEKRLVDTPSRQPAGRVYSQRYEEVGRSLISEKAVGPRDNHKSSRRWQSCRRDSIINSLLVSSQENEALSGSGEVVLPSGIDNSSDMHLSNSSDTIQGHSAYLSQTENAKFVFMESPDLLADRKSSRKSPAAIPESGHETPSLGSGDPNLQGQFQFLKQTDKPKHKRTSSSQSRARAAPMDSSPTDSAQVTEKKKIGDSFARPKISHRSSRSFDQDVYKKLMAQTRDNGRNASTSNSISQACSTTPKATKPQPFSPGASIQRWFANHFKLGSKSRSISTGTIRESQANEEQKPMAQEEKKPSKRSPWRTRPTEIFQGITRKKGSSKGASNGQLLDAQGLQKLRLGRPYESEPQFHLNGPDPWHNRMVYMGAGSNSIPSHRPSYLMPSVAAFSPAHPKGLQNLFRNRRQKLYP